MDDDDEPLFRRHYILDQTAPNKHGYWEDYNRLDRTWYRLCDECLAKISPSSTYLCEIHDKKLSKSKRKPANVKSKPRRVKRKKVKLPWNDQIETKDFIQLNEPAEIVISISATLLKTQLSHVKKFIKKFHNDTQSVQFTCESQPDYIDDSTTHVITNDIGLFTTNLSKQIIQACVRHIFIGSIQWIISSLEQSSILDHFSYEILRDKKSPHHTRGIKQCRFDHLPVFPSSYIIAVECHAGLKTLQITRDELIEMIELSGATLFDEYVECETLIILCQTKKEMSEKKKTFVPRLKKIFYCKVDFLFDSIVRHEVQNVEKYLW